MRNNVVEIRVECSASKIATPTATTNPLGEQAFAAD
jgi:hypothetical protein